MLQEPPRRAKRPWKRYLAASLLVLGLSGCVTSHVWRGAAHHGGCNQDAAKVLLCVTPVLLAIDLILLPWQFRDRGCR